jgi:hypothetical protein
LARSAKNTSSQYSSSWIESNFQLQYWLIDQPASNRANQPEGIPLSGKPDLAELKVKLYPNNIKTTIKLLTTGEVMPTSTFPIRPSLRGKIEPYLKIFTIDEKTSEGFSIYRLALSNPNVPLSILLLPFKMLTMKPDKMLKFLTFLMSTLNADLQILESAELDTAQVITDRKAFNALFKSLDLQSYNFIWRILDPSNTPPVENTWKIKYLKCIISCIAFLTQLDTDFETVEVSEIPIVPLK